MPEHDPPPRSQACAPKSRAAKTRTVIGGAPALRRRKPEHGTNRHGAVNDSFTAPEVRVPAKSGQRGRSGRPHVMNGSFTSSDDMNDPFMSSGRPRETEKRR
ncbi:hypothetical protein [Amycolatopsis sp. MEPSY49]|uniref:hypothetical protein n=1 Tax=Amycolatopsis sp. MEPSY49 TaxID=3151600 RepID=UPI003EF764DA